MPNSTLPDPTDTNIGGVGCGNPDGTPNGGEQNGTPLDPDNGVINLPPPPPPSAHAPGNPHFSASEFEADAYGRISHAPAPNDVDEWAIDSGRRLVNYVAGY